jgi:uncharacterized protein YkwD
VPRPRTARRALVSTLTALCGAAALVATAPAPADAAVTQTASCVDGGGVRWNAQAVWGKTYRGADHKTKVTLDRIAWTTPKAGPVRTDARVRVYDGAGTKVQDKAWSGSFDYRAGTRFKARNPLNPTSAPGKASVVLTVGVDGDGRRSCAVTLKQPAAAPAQTPAPSPTTPAPVTPTPAPTTPAVPPAPSTAPVSAADRYEADVLAATNAERRTAGLTALSAQACVDSFAEAQAQRMADQSRMYHQELSPVLSACGLRMVGENVAYGYPDGKAVTTGWMGSPGHRANILKPEYRVIGIGAAQNSQGRWYAAQVFGTLR